MYFLSLCCTCSFRTSPLAGLGKARMSSTARDTNADGWAAVRKEVRRQSVARRAIDSLEVSLNSNSVKSLSSLSTPKLGRQPTFKPTQVQPLGCGIKLGYSLPALGYLAV